MKTAHKEAVTRISKLCVNSKQKPISRHLSIYELEDIGEALVNF
jgi:hypothetical protein